MSYSKDLGRVIEWFHYNYDTSYVILIVVKYLLLDSVVLQFIKRVVVFQSSTVSTLFTTFYTKIRWWTVRLNRLSLTIPDFHRKLQVYNLWTKGYVVTTFHSELPSTIPDPLREFLPNFCFGTLTKGIIFLFRDDFCVLNCPVTTYGH